MTRVPLDVSFKITTKHGTNFLTVEATKFLDGDPAFEVSIKADGKNLSFDDASPELVASVREQLADEEDALVRVRLTMTREEVVALCELLSVLLGRTGETTQP